MIELNFVVTQSRILWNCEACMKWQLNYELLRQVVFDDRDDKYNSVKTVSREQEHLCNFSKTFPASFDMFALKKVWHIEEIIRY